MQKIFSIIPRQRFEIVRDRLGEILTEELAGQFILSGEDALKVTVWLERFVPFDIPEMPAVNIVFGRGDYSGKDQTQVRGEYSYFIDCYTAAPSSDNGAGDTMATINLHRLAGVIRAIIESPVYRTLGFTAPFNEAISVTSIAIAEPNNQQDATSSIQARLEVSVTVPELVNLITPLPFSAADTTVKIELTDKGYRYMLTPATGFPYILSFMLS